jgi:hypothetical protein
MGYADTDSYRPWLRDEFAFRCVFCLVREQWENPVGRHQEVPDPTQTLLSGTVVVQDDGTLVASTPAAAELLELLHLNYRTLCQRRQLLMAAVKVFREREPELYRRWMGFPDDLPDLSRLRPPGGNLRPEGVAQSHLARRERGELPATH